jgi:hypothetical protein
MIFEYKYYPSDIEAIQMKQAMRAKYLIKYVVLLVGFEITGNEEQGKFLTINTEEICSVVDTNDIPVEIHKQERIAIGEYLDYDAIDAACWKYWEAFHCD